MTSSEQAELAQLRRERQESSPGSRRITFGVGRSFSSTSQTSDGQIDVRAARAMMYALTFGGDPWTLEAVPPEALEGVHARVEDWWSSNTATGKILGGLKLMAPFSATTIRFIEGWPVIQDGPFTSEAEAVGGFSIIDVADLDEALTLARSWPLGGYVEIRPIMLPTSAKEVVVNYAAAVSLRG